MEFSLVAQFWVIGMLLTLTPGADWAYVIGAGVRAKSVGPSVFGLMLGYSLIIIAVAFGAGAVIAGLPGALTVLTLAGGLYLLYLGFGSLLAPAPELHATAEPVRSGAWGQFARGVGLSSINPKGFLLLIALLPQFTTSASPLSPTTQMLALGALQMLNVLVVYFAVGLLSRRLLGSRPRAGAIVAKVSGGLMILIGLAILVEQALEFAR